MITYNHKAIKIISKTYKDGNVIIKEKCESIVDHDGDTFHMVGWNGLTRTRIIRNKLQDRINKRNVSNRSDQECSPPHSYQGFQYG